MCPRIADIGCDLSDEDVFKSLENMIGGFPLPDNVIDYLNPFNYAPCNLPVDSWYLLRSKEREDVDFGFWKVKTESMLFSNPVITGWRTTHEFFGGQVPNEHKTDWLMHEYWITKGGVGESNQVKGASTLCRVFLSDNQAGQEMQQRVASSQNTSMSHDHPRQSVDQQAHSSSGSGSPCKPEANKNDDMGRQPAVAGPRNHQMEDPPEIDYLYRGDYLELLDLENPASPSSSSDNSSCLTMSSDDCFDSLAFLRELESETALDAHQTVENCKLSINVSARPDKVVVLPSSPAGSFVEVEGNEPQPGVIIRADSRAPDQTEADTKEQCNKVPKLSPERKKEVDKADEGPSTNHGDAGSSSRSTGAGKKDAKGRKRRLKRKYLCFMPFHMFF